MQWEGIIKSLKQKKDRQYNRVIKSGKQKKDRQYKRVIKSRKQKKDTQYNGVIKSRKHKKDRQCKVLIKSRKQKKDRQYNGVIKSRKQKSRQYKGVIKSRKQIETKLPRNDHWKVLYKVCVFYAGRKSKMATTAGHRLTLDPMGKMFQNASSLKPLGQLKPNCPGMISENPSVNRRRDNTIMAKSKSTKE